MVNGTNVYCPIDRNGVKTMHTAVLNSINFLGLFAKTSSLKVAKKTTMGAAIMCPAVCDVMNNVLRICVSP